VIAGIGQLAFRDQPAAAVMEITMLDLMFIAIGLAFLAGAMLYAHACERM
jgi:hypothetical protein